VTSKGSVKTQLGINTSGTSGYGTANIDSKMKKTRTTVSRERSRHMFAQPVNEHIMEEMLVIYYITIVIYLSKLSDGIKAITEYKDKKGLSNFANAHIFKLLAVLTMLSEKEGYK
jgi:uncharacterized protein YjgD (DUF1641 family)